MPRWLLPALVLLLVLGHACELPAFAGLMSGMDIAEDAHHAPGGGADEHAISCDGVAVVSDHGVSAAPLGLAATVVQSVSPSTLARPAMAPAQDPVTRLKRPPLFLLFASLLI